MARIIDENFEGAGYEESWAETVDPGCILDEDSVIPGTSPPRAGLQCLKASIVDNTNNDANALEIKTLQNISYIRGYLYLESESLIDGQYIITLRLMSSSALSTRIDVGQNAGVLQMRFAYRSAGATQYTAWVNISLNTWYRVEYKYDITNLQWEWKIDGVTQASGSLASATNTPDRLYIGIAPSTNVAACVLYTDLVVWDDVIWPGAESMFPTPHIWWSDI